jgi:hypothetical protein
MKLAASFLILLQILVLPAFAAEPPRECTFCVGVVSDLAAPETETVPLLVETTADDLAAAASSIDALTPEQRKKLTLVITYAVDKENDALLDIEQRTKSLIEWARLHGPFDAIGIAVTNADASQSAYAIKRLAVAAQGLNVAARIVLPRTAQEQVTALFDNGAQPYFDAMLVDASSVASTVAWLAEKDPAKKVFAVVTPNTPNPFYDAGKAIADGATRAYVKAPVDRKAVASFNQAFVGDWGFDATAKNAVLDAKGNPTDAPVLTFVRGEDLRTIVIPRGDASASTIVALASEDFAKPRRIDAAGEKDVTDTGRRGGRFLIGMPPGAQPYLIAVDRAEKSDVNVTKETIDVATQRGITVEEILRNHQAYDAYQESIQPRYVARNTTKLRFEIGAGAESLEASIAGDYFSDPQGRADWVWQDFHINGVRWKYGRIPELPLIQPEKVTQLPLDIHLSNEYRYQLVRETNLDGYRVYEVRFEPPPNAPAELPLYRGTVFVDTRTWARVRIAMIQLNLTGEVLSNEERVDFVPFSRATKQPLTQADAAKIDARELIWLPLSVNAQQVISAAGRASVVQRATSFTDFRVEPSDYEALLARVSQSDARMVRETKAGLRYLERRGDGERVVKEGFDTSQLFMLGGVHHDSGLEYPVVPLGGVDYFNFDFLKRGIQTNVFFAGVVLAVNATHPNVANTRTNVGLDFFGIAIPTENKIFRGGEEQPGEVVKARPMGLFFRAGHPVLNFGKVDVNFGVQHLTYGRADDTATGFAAPSSTFVLSPSINAQYARRGYSISGFFDYNRRTAWEPWGNLAEYDPEQKSFTKFGGSVGKSFYLPKFQRISVDAAYLDGRRLDRFSKYELGFFGAQRVHGVESGSVRAEKMIIGHLSYGFVFSEQFRLEAFYDHASIDDAIAGYRQEPFQGLGIAGQTVGPYGTLVRLDIGKTIGRNAQDGFVANVVFLKLF